MPENNDGQQNNPPPAAAAAPAAATGITQEALHAAVEKARLEERTKLREQIQTLEGKVKDLDADNKNLSADKAKLTESLATLKASIKPDGGGVDIDKLAEGIEARIAKAYDARLAEVEGQLANERTTREKMSLEQLRAQLIQQNGGEDAMLIELVRGNNAAELQASIEEAKAKLQKYVKRAGTPPSQQNNGNGGGNPPPNPPVPSGGAGASAGGGAAETINVKDMPMSEYGKRRSEITKKVVGRYANNIRQ